MLATILLSCLALLFASCGPANQRVEMSDATQAAVRQAGDGGTVDMRQVASFDWDRMYAFCCYTRDVDVSDTIGFSWGNGDNLRLPSDSMVLLMFVNDKEVAGWVILNDSEPTGPVVHFDDAVYYVPVPRESARFRATLAPEKTTAGHDIYVLRLAP